MWFGEASCEVRLPFYERNTMKRKAISILILAILSLGCYLMGYHRARVNFRGSTKVIRDTLEVRDTQAFEKPDFVDRKSKEPSLVAVRDTLRIKDTLYIPLPMETKIYKSDEYYAEVSGYKPSLDRIEVYPKTMVISKTETTTLEPSPWRVSIDVGLDYSRMDTKYISPNIGAEIGYKRIAFNAEMGVDLRMVDMTILEPHPYWKVGMKYSLFRR